MLLSLKELVIILVVSTIIFKLAEPMAVLFGDRSDYIRRRNVWILITVSAFLAPNFTVFCLLAVPTLIWAGRRDSNPVALYVLLLHVIPPIPVTLHMIGVSKLFDLNNYNLLALFLMLPAAVRLRRSKNLGDTPRGLKSRDVLLLAYGALTSVLFVLPEADRGVLYQATIPNDFRRGFVFLAFTYVPYYVISRSLVSKKMLVEAMMAFCVACFIMAGIAICESVMKWLLYGDIANRWGYGINFTLYYVRGASLRAAASSGHPLVLGYLTAIALGFWLYLRDFVTRAMYRIGALILLMAGLVACFSRGAWIAAVVIYFTYAALGPRAMSRLIKSTLLVLLGTIVLSFTPLGDKIFSVIPFFGGSIDSSSYVYRQLLLERAWQIIQESPFFGDQMALLKMQDLRQGEGIIDVINAYVGVLLDNGFIGLSLVIGFVLTALVHVISCSRRMAVRNPDFSKLGLSLTAAIVGTLFFLLDGNLGGGVERMFYALVGFASAYISGFTMELNVNVLKHTRGQSSV